MLSPVRHLNKHLLAALALGLWALAPFTAHAQCDAGKDFYSYCYGLPENNTVAFEICPDDPAATVEADIIQGVFLHNPPTLVATLTVYEGATGTGTAGSVVFGPQGTGVAGSMVASNTAGNCLIFVINASNDFGVSCQGGSSAAIELQVCGSDVGGSAPVTFFAPNDLCVDDGIQTNLSGGMPDGGTYSGPGVTDNANGTYDFDPAMAGAGVKTLTYTVGGDEASDNVEVFVVPMVTFTALSDLCIDAGTQTNLSGATPSGGTYSGPGVTDNGDGTYDFNPAAAGLGIHDITYTENGLCEGTAMNQVEVLAACGCPMGQTSHFYCYDNNENNTVAFEVCPTAGQSPKATITAGTIGSNFSADNDVLNVYSGMPGSGTAGILVSGPLTGDVSSTVIDGPAADQCLIFVITSGPIGSCATPNGLTAETALQVCGESIAPEVNLMALADLCIDEGIQAGLSGGNPEGGTYSGPGVTDNGNSTYDFDPAAAGAGVHIITYTLSGTEATDEVEVFATGVVSFTALNDLCSDAGIQTNLSGGTPTGGTFSGPGVIDNGDGTYDFNPGVAGVGIHVISYTQPGGCEETAMDNVEVLEACSCPNGEISRYACFGNNQAEGTIFEICPDAGKAAQATITAGTLGGDDVLTVYQGSTGSGSTILFGPATNVDLTGEEITGTALDQCLIFVLSTGPVSSCQDGFEEAIQVCGRSVVPDLAFTALDDLSISAGLQTGLTGGTPSGGLYAGPGVTDGNDGMTYSFDPAVAGVGVHIITYSVGGNMVSDDVEVFDAVPGFSAEFLPSVIGPGGSSRLTFTIDNSFSPNPVEELAFSNTLPAGLVIADAPQLESTCIGGTLTGPAGGGTLTFSGGELGSGSECTLSVNVTVATVGVFTNVSGDLTSDRGNSGAASDDLTVNNNRPGFYKSFSPSTVDAGQTSRLTLTIDNSEGGGNVFNISYSDQLPEGMLVAQPANLENTCLTSPIISADRTTISAFSIFLQPAQSCTVAFDVVTQLGSSTLENVTDVLASSSGDGGFATATLNVTQPSTDIFLQKSFVNDPVSPGSEVDLTFTISNLNRDLPMTDITFTDDLDAALSGLVAVGLPATDICGAGSTLTGTSTLTLNDGALPPGGSCTFTVTLQVPPGASTGTYPNTTSNITASTMEGPATGDPAQDNLYVNILPTLTKTFQSEEAVPGSIVDLTFELTNPNGTETITDISFTDNLSAFMSGATFTPAAPSACGGVVFTSVSGDILSLIFSNGELAPNETCSFTGSLNIPEGIPAGTYTNTTSLVSSTVNGATTESTGASDDLTILPAPTITKSIQEEAILPGETATVEFTLEYSDQATSNATNISFTDDLDVFLSGTTVLGALPTAPCGEGSSVSGTSALSLTGATLEPGGSCTFQVTIQVPNDALPGTYTNNTSALTSEINGLNATSPGSSDQLVISGLEYNLVVLKSPVVPGDQTTLEFSFENISLVDITNMFFTLDLNSVISGMTSTSGTQNDVVGTGSSVTGTTFLIFTGGNLSATESASFTVDVNIPGNAADNQYSFVSSNISADFDSQTAALQPFNAPFEVQSELIGLEKEFMPNSTEQGGVIDVVYTLTNINDDYTLNNISFTDDFDGVLSGLEATGLPISACGGTASGTGVLSLTGASLSAGGNCTFTVTLQVPNGVGGAFTSTTSAVTGNTETGSFPITGNAASDEFKVESVNLVKAFGAPTVFAGTTTTLEFTLTNNGDQSISELSFTDNLNAMASGMVSVSGLQSNICGTGSSISGTSLLTFSGGILDTGGTCTFSVTVELPCDLAEGTYTNTTSEVLSSGLPVGQLATETLDIELENVDPEIECPAAITIECDESTEPANTGIATAIDNCTSGLIPTSEDEEMLINGLGTIERTWSVTDDASNSAQCVQIITIEDTTDPEFSTFPMNAVVECGESTDPANTGTPVVIDNCSSPMPAYDDGMLVSGCSNTGSFERTWMAEDNAGNTVMQIQTITIVDNTMPDFVDFPANTTVECGASTDPADTGMPDGTDVCGTVMIGHVDSFVENCGNSGTITRTWTITDACGNMNEQDQSIIIEDTTPPELTCPGNITVPNDEGDCGALVSFSANAMDNCGPAMVSYSIAPGSFFDVGTVAVEVNAIDACNNMATSCNFSVTVTDTEPPVPVCLDTEVLIEPDGSFEVLIEEVIDMDASTDNCALGMAEITSTVISCDEAGSIVPVEVNLSDEAGNIGTCTASLTVTIGDALPDPYESVDIGVSNNGNDYAYNSCKKQFSITSTASNPPSAPEDEQAYISVELCGDFGMQVRLDSLLGDSGYGGMMIRESNSPGSKQVSLLSNMTSLVRWEHRQVTDDIKQTALYYKPFPTYLRLIRRGNLVRGRYSTTGDNYQSVSIVEIDMSECLQIGITAFSNDPFGETKAVFSKVRYKEFNNTALSQEDMEWLEGSEVEQSPTLSPSQTVQVYPNPVYSGLTLEWPSPQESPATLILHNNLGQAIETRILEPGNVRTFWDVSLLTNGLYLIEVRNANGTTQLLRFIKAE